MHRQIIHTRIFALVSVLLTSLLLAGVTAALEVGEQAPDFTLPATTGEKISLSQYQGKQLVLLEFFPGFSPT